MSKMRVHFIGIGGIGMSGLARVLLQQGHEVSGSDLRDTEITCSLRQMGATVFEGHRASQVSPGAVVVYSTQVQENNPEYLAAKEQGCLLWHRSKLLCHLAAAGRTLAVAGTHGKTTTTSLLTMMLVRAGWDPSFAVGGIVNELRCNAGWGKGGYFVLEADESDGSFLGYAPTGAIVTNIDDDHLDHYGSQARLVQAFGAFLEKVSSKELLFWCKDNQWLCSLKPQGISYGFDESADLQVIGAVQQGWHIAVDLRFLGQTYKEVRVALTGRHNALNAAAVFGMALQLGISEQVARHVLESFGGVGRRSEKKGLAGDVLVVDDYGHHPTEIKATLAALRRAEPDRRLVVAFQPHRYTRTAQCLESFGHAFDAADELFITDIYAAMEPPIEGVDASLVLREVQKNSQVACRYVAKGELVSSLSSFVRPHDLVLTVGAGDITKVGRELLETLAKTCSG